MPSKTVLAFGTFDLLHAGHLRCLEQAAALGDRLVVVVARDATVQKLKGVKPINSEKDRCKLVAALRFVDKAVLGEDYFEDKFEIVRKLNPQVLALGYDQGKDLEKIKQEVKKAGIDADVVRLDAYQEELYKSTRLKKRLQKML